MKHISRAIAISSILLLLTISSVYGQAERAIVDIPFNFVAGEKVMLAGRYLIQPNKRDSATVWVVRNIETNDTTAFIAAPVRTSVSPEDTKLIFRRYDDLYFLSEFWFPGENTGREVRASEGEKVLAELLERKPSRHILIARSR